MKKYILWTFLLASTLFISCQNDRMIEAEEDKYSEQTDIRGNYVEMPERVNILPGVLYVKVSRSCAEDLRVNQQDEVSLQSVPSKMAASLTKINTTSVRKLFPTDKRYKKRHQKAGLDQWFVISFDDTDPLEAQAIMARLEEVEVAEEQYRMALPETQMMPLSEEDLRGLRADDRTYPFNDPLLPTQWHYKNYGNIGSSKPNADINLFPAWEIETGKPNVIIGVIDGGIDYTHEDIKDNMWVNLAELNGTPGVDDDGNGYVDDVYGYSFVKYLSDPLPPGKVEPDDAGHATHVAGTVAAKNNNGIGVSGVAGGDGSPESGVRLMTCAIFRKGREGGDAAAAFVYSADNGAVISQNSWGYVHPGPGRLPYSLKQAIDYFIDNAGCDDDGNQLATSPMHGGVVIFAAGNDETDYVAQPSAYERVVSVSAMAYDFTKGYYTNRGAWVTLMAPGGDSDRFGAKGGVISSVPPSIYKGEKYGSMQGTSMACPHVSGIAGLIASKFGGPGFTNEHLKMRLTNSFLPYDINAYNPGFENRLGKGYIDAYGTLITNEEKAPEAPKFKEAEVGFVQMEVKWTVPMDEDDGQPSTYKLFMSKEPLNDSNYTSGAILAPREHTTINGVGKKPGDEMSFRVSGLKDNTTYYFALVAYDRWGLRSPIAYANYTTKENHPPKATGLPEGMVSVSNLNSEQFSIKVNDEDGHKWDYELSGDTKGVSVKREGDNIHFTIYPMLDYNVYALLLKLTDELGAVSEYTIPFEIFEYIPPKYKGGLEDMIIGLNEGKISIPLQEMFEHNERYTLKLSAKSYDGSIASAEVIGGNVMEITTHKLGLVSIKVESEDDVKKGDEVRFAVRVVENSNAAVHMVYPLPVRTNLNMLINKSLTSVEAIVTTLRGEEVLRKNVTADPTHIGRLNLKSLPSGTYKLHVKSSKETYTRTFVKH